MVEVLVTVKNDLPNPYYHNFTCKSQKLLFRSSSTGGPGGGGSQLFLGGWKCNSFYELGAQAKFCNTMITLSWKARMK